MTILTEHTKAMGSTNPVNLSKPKTKLAFSGGGSTAFTELGIFNALEDNGRIGKLEEVAGTSAGSMMAGLVAFGYRGDECNPMTINQDFSWFTSFEKSREKLNVLPNMLGHKQGIFTGQPLRGWMEHAIAKRTGKPDMTFEELHQWRIEAKKSVETGNMQFFEDAAREAFTADLRGEFERKYKDFNNEQYADGSDKPFTLDFETAEELRDNVLKMADFQVVASEVVEKDGKTAYKEARFSYKNDELKSVPIAQAVEASASFPYVFARERINGKLYTDGGLVNHLPLEVFNTQNGQSDPDALGIAVIYKPSEQLKNNDKQLKKFENVVRIRNKLLPNDWDIAGTRTAADKIMEAEYGDNHNSYGIIQIEVSDISPTDFSITPEQKAALIQSGYKRSLEAIKASDNEYSKPIPTIKPDILAEVEKIQDQIPPQHNPNSLGRQLERVPTWTNASPNTNWVDAVTTTQPPTDGKFR